MLVGAGMEKRKYKIKETIRTLEAEIIIQEWGMLFFIFVLFVNV